MAPARVDSSGALDFQNPLRPFFQAESIAPLIFDNPGFIRLVNKKTIEHFVTTHSTSDYVARFPAKGCDRSWFEPDETNENGIPCLVAHSQILQAGIMYEAGVTSLYQLLKSYNYRQEKLFRDDAAVNIIFVSDTHDAGALDFYGSVNAYASMIPFSSLKQEILNNNPAVKNFTIHGVVPLPVAGDPLYDGLKVMGNKPQTQAEADLNTEGNGQHGYSYLPYIRESFGTAIHTNNTRWDELMKALIQETGRPNRPIVELPCETKRIDYLKIDGVLMNSDQYFLRPDQKTIEINLPIEWNQEISVVIDYYRKD